jgi:hypothetical protein
VLQAPTIREDIAVMVVAVRGASDTEVDGVVWNPTYTATVRWEESFYEGEGEWVFEVQQDAVPGDPVARCGLGSDGNDAIWEGSGDRTTDLAVRFAADHLHMLLDLARNLAARSEV